VTDDQVVDRHLGAVYEALVNAVSLTKQVLWSGSAPRDQMQDLLAFLVEQAREVDEAEARIDGRSARLVSPSGHERENLLGDVQNDLGAAFDVYVETLTDLLRDVRRRAALMGETAEARLLVDLAAGLETRIAELDRSD
jgi:hypothetical protein